MKLHSLITYLALGTAFAASAQTAADPQQPTPKSEASTVETGIRKPPPPTAARVTLRDLRLQPGTLPKVVEQVQYACSKAVTEKKAAALAEAQKDPPVSDEVLVRRLYIDIVGAVPSAQATQEFIQSNDAEKRAKLIDRLLEGQSMPMLIFGPGTSEVSVSMTLHLEDVRPLDALAVLAAAAGCTLQPIYSPPQEGEGKMPHILGYGFALPPGRIIHSVPLTKDGEKGTGELAGIGVALENKDGNIVVGQVIPGSPADRIHVLKPGDRILQVAEDGKADVDITGLPLEKVAEMIRGKAGSSVRLTIAPASGREGHVDRLVREKLDLTAADALIPKVAVVDTPVFYSHIFFDRPEGGPLQLAKAGGPLKAPRPPATQEETDLPLVRIYALGLILNGNDAGGNALNLTEDDFKKLLADALDNAGVTGAPKIYFHTKARVLVAKATAREHDIIEQVINALRENEGYRPMQKPQ